jgi:hypothetical protein
MRRRWPRFNFFQEIMPGKSANRKCALSSALLRRVKVPLALLE